MKMLTDTHYAQLLNNGRRQLPVRGTDREIDLEPVVKLFYPGNGATWLLTEIDPEDTDLAVGLCDLGLGFPEFGSVLLSELAEVRGPSGLTIERDLHWKARAPISVYIDVARTAGRIIEPPRARWSVDR